MSEPGELDVARDLCPKHMEYGPCGGVALTGECEVSPQRCVFLDQPTVRWSGPASVGKGASRIRETIVRRQIVVADFPARALDAQSLADCAGMLAGSVDAVLAGDSGAARVQFPPSYRAHLIQQAGVAVWAGVNCRDRNRVALEGEISALAHVGVAGVHCVTGDHTLIGSRPDAAAVFDLDSTRVAALAAAAGHLVSVGESPATPPTERRPSRLLEKIRAGAQVCYVNHAGGVGPVSDFMRQTTDLGLPGHFTGFIPCIPIVVDHESARLLASFPGLVLPEGYLDRILAARDPRSEGIAAAAELGQAFLALEGVIGVNLSGGPGVGRELWFAEALAEVAETLDLVRN